MLSFNINKQNTILPPFSSTVILILAFLIYQLIVWIKNTKAWMLLKGILVLAVFILVAAILQMNTILFIAKNLVTVMATAAVVVFQPELRRVLEKIGEIDPSQSFMGWLQWIVLLTQHTIWDE